MSDDQGWGDLSATGNTNLHTPNIDGIAERGVRFDRFYVTPICSPTRAELLTGRYHPRGGIHSTSAGGERLDLDETTIAEVFKSAGYATGAFGKWHNGMQPPYHPNARGFDEYYGFASGHWGNYFSPTLEHNGRLVQGEGYIVDDLTDRAMSFITENQARPFFVYLPLNTPHSPMQVPDRWWEEFAGKELGLRHREPERENVPFTRAALAMCENIDWNVGRLMDHLSSLGLEKETIFMYFSDNGPNSYRWNDGMRGRKGSIYEGGVRSPFFIQWPETIEGGGEIEEIAGVIDLLPTLADLAGIPLEVDKPLDGVSLKPLLMEEEPLWPDRLIFSRWRRSSVRSRRFMLDHEGQLFDMFNDPGQYTDVSSEFTEEAERLQTALEEWNATVVAELPEEDTRPFPIGHPDHKWTQLPARDGVAHGSIERSNRFPNCSFYTNWTSVEDKITWDVEVLADGEFEVTLYYTVPASDVGASFVLQLGDQELETTISEAHDPPLTGMEHDLVERMESYVKDFKPLVLGRMSLEEGPGTLTLRATEIPGEQVMDFRLLMFRRVEGS